jgi:hypothetical protein
MMKTKFPTKGGKEADDDDDGGDSTTDTRKLWVETTMKKLNNLREQFRCAAALLFEKYPNRWKAIEDMPPLSIGKMLYDEANPIPFDISFKLLSDIYREEAVAIPKLSGLERFQLAMDGELKPVSSSKDKTPTPVKPVEK